MFVFVTYISSVICKEKITNTQDDLIVLLSAFWWLHSVHGYFS